MAKSNVSKSAPQQSIRFQRAPFARELLFGAGKWSDGAWISEEVWSLANSIAPSAFVYSLPAVHSFPKLWETLSHDCGWIRLLAFCRSEMLRCVWSLETAQRIWFGRGCKTVSKCLEVFFVHTFLFLYYLENYFMTFMLPDTCYFICFTSTKPHFSHFSDLHFRVYRSSQRQ